MAAGVVVGGLVGGAVAGLIYLPTAENEYNFTPALIGGGVGLITAIGVSSVVAARRVEVAPAAMRAPMGEPGLGLSLRLGV